MVLTGYLRDLDTVDLNILNLRYTCGISLGGIDVKLHPSSIRVETASSLTSGSEIFLDVYPLQFIQYVSIHKTVYHKSVTVRNTIGMNLWSYPQYYSSIYPYDTHNKLQIGVYRFTASELTGFRRIILIGLKTRSVALTVKYYQFSSISMSSSHRILGFGIVTPLSVASTYPISP